MRSAIAAAGKWLGLLVDFGVPKEALTGKHVDCPICGKRNFRFDDRGKGSWICTCGSGDGFALTKQVLGWGFKETADMIDQRVSFVRPTEQAEKMSDEAKAVALRRVYSESLKMEDGDTTSLYLRKRGILSLPAVLAYDVRTHPCLEYRDDEGFVVGKYPAMIAVVRSPDGSGATIHRTWLDTAGNKANVSQPKKLMPGLPLTGAAIRLFPSGECLGIAEGIETALAAAQLFSVPTWACVSSGIMEKFVPPAGVKSVIVFGDNDNSFTGQASAYAVAKRLKTKGLDVEVRMPDDANTDWADVVAL